MKKMIKRCYKCGTEGPIFSPFKKRLFDWPDNTLLFQCFCKDYANRDSESRVWNDSICLKCFNNLDDNELLKCSMSNWANSPPFDKIYQKWKKLIIEKVKREGTRNYWQFCHGGFHCCSGPCCVLFPEYVKSSEDCEEYWDEGYNGISLPEDWVEWRNL